MTVSPDCTVPGVAVTPVRVLPSVARAGEAAPAKAAAATAKAASPARVFVFMWFPLGVLCAVWVCCLRSEEVQTQVKG